MKQYAISARVTTLCLVLLLARSLVTYAEAGLTGAVLRLLPNCGISAQASGSEAEPSLAKRRFADPPAETRILKIIHNLPDSPEHQHELLQSLAGQGFGGMVTNVAFAGYLESDEKWASFTRGVREARDMGMALWLYDERGYPSCKAGGLTLRDHPEWQAQGIYIADAMSAGGDVSIAVPPGELQRAAAFPITNGVTGLEQGVDLSGQTHDGVLTWNAPAGHWHVMVITRGYLHEGTHADGNLSDANPYPNLLMPEPARRFIELTHGAYAQRLGNDLGAWFIATFTDEPSLMSLFMKRQPYRVLPWAPNLAGEFERRRGYALEPLIPALVSDAGTRALAVRYDFWLTVGELVSENYFGQIQSWCREHNTLSGGHLLLEESLLGHVPLYGDFFRCIRRLDAPSIDCLTSIPADVPWSVARLISSAAELENRSVTMSETSDHVQRYRREGDDRPVRVVTEDEIRGTCNRLMLNGITTITSYYSFAGLSTDQIVCLNEWVGRCCTMLKGGFQVADVALLYPAESVWPRFTPSRHWTEDCPAIAQRIQSVYGVCSNALFEARRDFTYVDGQALCETTVDNGVLRHGNLEWRVVVLPCADTLPLRAWETLAAFWRSGGALVAVSCLPANSEKEFPSSAVTALAKEVFGTGETPGFSSNNAGGAGVFLPPGSEGLLPLVLDSLLEQDVRLADRRAPIRVTHRRIDGHEVYFLINDGGEPWSGVVGFAAHGEGEQWDPATGQTLPLASANDVPLTLGPYGAMFFRFVNAQPPERKTPGEGTLPMLSLSQLPSAQPTVGKGEFVEGGVEQRPNGDWRSHAQLTKGDTDTHLFVSFACEKPLDLRDTICLVVDSTVPEGQGAPTPLRIIVQDAHGAEYIANTDRPLNAPGSVRCFVPLDQFERAGWNQATHSSFDWSAVTTVRAGWGGYLGTQGETIEFTLSALHVARLADSLVHP